MVRRTGSLMLSLLAATGCRSAVPARPAANASMASPSHSSAVVGQHAFSASLPGGVKLAGILVVTGDTIVPRPTDGECRLASPTAVSRQHVVYECSIPGVSGIMLAFDRVNPVRRSTWGLATTVRKTRDVCREWRTWENGARTCTRTTPEDYFERAQSRGQLTVVPP